MKLKFKKLNDDAVLPSYARPGDGGLDMTTCEDGKTTFSKEGDMWYYVEYNTGLAVQIPEGHVGLLFPRSSISKSSLILANSVGVVDSSYRGPVCFRFKIDAGVISQTTKDRVGSVYKKGDRIGQLIVIPYPTMEPEFVDELSVTERGEGGFGSTNEKKEIV